MCKLIPKSCWANVHTLHLPHERPVLTTNIFFLAKRRLAMGTHTQMQINSNMVYVAHTYIDVVKSKAYCLDTIRCN